MNYCSLFLYFSFFSPFFFCFREGDLDVGAFFILSEKRKRGTKCWEQRKEEDRAEAEKPEERVRGDISLPAVPPSGLSARYQEAAESAWWALQLSMPRGLWCAYIQYVHIYVVIYVPVYTLECMLVFANVFSGRLLCGYSRAPASAADCMTHRRPRPRRLGSRLRHRSRLRCPSPPVRCRPPLPPPSPWFSSPSRAPRAAPSRKHAKAPKVHPKCEKTT